jgi:hypothetical protein
MEASSKSLMTNGAQRVFAHNLQKLDPCLLLNFTLAKERKRETRRGLLQSNKKQALASGLSHNAYSSIPGNAIQKPSSYP